MREIYGEDLLSAGGVIHVAAVWKCSPDQTIVLRPGPDAPHGQSDQFALALARARSDAIVTTGANLRAEPSLCHDLEGPDAVALGAWRRERLQKTSTPRSVILTRGRALDFGHPLFQRGHSPALVVTTPEAAAELAGRAPPEVEVVGRKESDLRELLRYLRDDRGWEDIGVEAGPTTARGLYRAPPFLDELMLSIYCGSDLPEAVRGPEFLSQQVIDDVLEARGPGWEVRESGARWLLRRYRRSVSVGDMR